MLVVTWWHNCGHGCGDVCAIPCFMTYLCLMMYFPFDSYSICPLRCGYWVMNHISFSKCSLSPRKSQSIMEKNMCCLCTSPTFVFSLVQTLSVDNLENQPQPQLDCSQLKHFAREAQLNQDYQLATKYYQEVQKKIVCSAILDSNNIQYDCMPTSSCFNY